MFTRSKIVDGKKYYYLVESYRSDGKVRQRTLAYLGKMDSVKGAMDLWEEELAALTKATQEALAWAEDPKRVSQKSKFLEFADRFEKRCKRLRKQIEKIRSIGTMA